MELLLESIVNKLLDPLYCSECENPLTIPERFHAQHFPLYNTAVTLCNECMDHKIKELKREQLRLRKQSLDKRFGSY